MDRTLGIFSASALALFLVIAAMVSSATGGHATTSSIDGALRAANGFVTNEATYKFDGMKDTLAFDAVNADQNSYEVSGDFVSAHGGYGDRTGQIVTEALTPHNFTIVVSNGHVVSAVMDGSYDMITQKSLN